MPRPGLARRLAPAAVSLCLFAIAVSALAGGYLRKPAAPARQGKEVAVNPLRRPSVLPQPQLSEPEKGVVANASIEREVGTGQVRRVRGRLRVPTAKNPVEAARYVLVQNARTLGISPDLRELTLQRETKSLSGTHVRYTQTHGGLPVFGGTLSLHADKAGVINLINNDLVVLGNGAVIQPANAAAAITAAVKAVNASAPRNTPKATAGIINHNGITTAVWRVSFVTSEPPGDWEVMVDPRTRAILSLRNIARAVTGSGMVYLPNPVQSAGDASYTDINNADSPALSAARVSRPFEGLDSTGKLQGQFASTVPSTLITRVTEPTFNFNYTRNQSGFEEAMCYYHIDANQRYIQSLGFNNVNNRVQGIDVNGTTVDNSWYMPSTGNVTFGTGGVDDAEDADVILHEMGHSIQHNQVPGWGASMEAGAMGEGFGDYWAGSWAANYGGPRSPAWDVYVAKWDAVSYGSPPPVGFPYNLRMLDSTKRYPDDIVGQVHADGEIWSACLWEIRGITGRQRADTMILEGHFSVSPFASFADGANSILSANQALYAGQDHPEILDVFVRRGILIKPSDFTVTLDPDTVRPGEASLGTITILNPAPVGGAVVSIASADTSVATVSPDTVTIPEGETTANFTVLASSQITFRTSVEISAAWGNLNGFATLNVIPYLEAVEFLDPNFGFWTSFLPILGGDLVFARVLMSDPAPPGGAVITLQSSDPSVAYVTPSVTVQNGWMDQTFLVWSNPVANSQGVDITALYNGTGVSGQLLVLSPAPTFLTISPATVSGGTSASATVWMDAPAPPQGLLVNLTSSDSSATVPATVLVQPGKDNATFPISTTSVTSVKVAQIEAEYEGVIAGNTLTIVNFGIRAISFNPSNVIGGGVLRGTVTLTQRAPTGGAQVDLSKDDPSGVIGTLPAITVPSGATVASFTIPTNAVTTDSTATITANINGETGGPSATVNVESIGVKSVSVYPLTMRANTSTSSAYVFLNGPAPAGGATVLLSATAGTLPSSVTIPQGGTAYRFTYTAPTTVPPGGKATITATYPAGKSRSTTITIWP